MKCLATALTLSLAVSTCVAQSVEGSLQFLDLNTTPGVSSVQVTGREGPTVPQYSQSSEEIPIPGGFPFDTTNQKGVYVNSQGYISFKGASHSFTFTSLPDYTVAPFWNDGTSFSGRTEYEVHDATVTTTELLDHVSTFITKQLCLSADFSGRWMLLVEWEQRSEPLVNNFQAAVITDGSQSYAVFTYHCQRMTRTNIEYNIGFSANRDFEHIFTSGATPFEVGCGRTNQFSSSIIYKLDSGRVCSEEDIRLEQCGSNEGRVQICSGSRTPGYWMNVCDRTWTETEAAVVCRQLGFTPEGAVNQSNNMNTAISTMHPECHGQEDSLFDCLVTVNEASCSPVGVKCHVEPETDGSSGGGDDLAVIIGAGVGMVVLVAVILTVVLVVVCVRSRRTRTKDVEDRTAHGKEAGETGRYSHKVQNLTSNSTSAKSQGFAPPEYATPDVGVQRIGETRFIDEVANPNYNGTVRQGMPAIHNYEMPKGEGDGEELELNLSNPLYHPGIPVGTPCVSPSLGSEQPSQSILSPREYEVAVKSPVDRQVHQYEDVSDTTSNTVGYSRLDNGTMRHQYAMVESVGNDVGPERKDSVTPTSPSEAGYSRLDNATGYHHYAVLESPDQDAKPEREDSGTPASPGDTGDYSSLDNGTEHHHYAVLESYGQENPGKLNSVADDDTGDYSKLENGHENSQYEVVPETCDGDAPEIPVSPDQKNAVAPDTSNHFEVGDYSSLVTESGHHLLDSYSTDTPQPKDNPELEDDSGYGHLLHT